MVHITFGSSRVTLQLFVPKISLLWGCSSPDSKTLGSTSIRYRSDAFASDRHLIDVDPMVFPIWATSLAFQVPVNYIQDAPTLLSVVVSADSDDPPLWWCLAISRNNAGLRSWGFVGFGVVILNNISYITRPFHIDCPELPSIAACEHCINFVSIILVQYHQRLMTNTIKIITIISPQTVRDIYCG